MEERHTNSSQVGTDRPELLTSGQNTVLVSRKNQRLCSQETGQSLYDQHENMTDHVDHLKRSVSLICPLAIHSPET